MTEVADEVSASDFRRACRQLMQLGQDMARADPDELATHYLPALTTEVALIFNFVGSNMTARHVTHFARTVATLEAAKDRASSPQQGEDP